ncbi:MAG: sigma-70 family RNA polymerase sigma factor [Verrucomicrobia bacterium]|nr:sigma-70 family RNA polymerase sigma factor [Verrucomicrobiota bacterium]
MTSAGERCRISDVSPDHRKHCGARTRDIERNHRCGTCPAGTAGVGGDLRGAFPPRLLSCPPHARRSHPGRGCHPRCLPEGVSQARRFQRQLSIRTWLYRITINHCQNLLQTWHRRNIHGTDDEAVWERAAGTSDSPLRVLETKELGQRIQKSLDSLPEEYRLLLLLVADEKLSYDEVGTLTGQSSDAVRGKLHRARKTFAAAFHQTP